LQAGDGDVLFILARGKWISDFLQGAAFGVNAEKSFYYGGANHQYGV
jgi:hypothetical protein